MKAYIQEGEINIRIFGGREGEMIWFRDSDGMVWLCEAHEPMEVQPEKLLWFDVYYDQWLYRWIHRWPNELWEEFVFASFDEKDIEKE